MLYIRGSFILYTSYHLFVKMQESKLSGNLIKGIMLLIVFILIIIPASLNVIRYMQLPKEGIYSIGEITNIFDDRFSASSINFTFKYQNNTYTDVSKTDEYDRSLIGKKFFVLFLTKHPKIVKILLDKPVPNHLKNSPYEGWKQLP